MKNVVLKSVLHADAGRAPAQCGVFLDQLVHLLIKVSREIVSACTPTLSDGDTLCRTAVCHRLQNHDLEYSKEVDQLASGAPETQHQSRTLLYSYNFNTSEEVANPLRIFRTSRFYA